MPLLENPAATSALREEITIKRYVEQVLRAIEVKGGGSDPDLVGGQLFPTQQVPI